jgi:hypothetical protein
MARRQPNHRLVKIHRTYTVNEIADRLHHHKNTVREWIRNGLPTIDGKRPTLIRGNSSTSFKYAGHERSNPVPSVTCTTSDVVPRNFQPVVWRNMYPLTTRWETSEQSVPSATA